MEALKGHGMTQTLGVAAWLFSFATSTGVDPSFVGASSESGAITEGEAFFSETVALTIPATLPLEEGVTDERFALLVWSNNGGAEKACAYLSDGEAYQLADCDDGDNGQPLQAGSVVPADYVAVWSDVEAAQSGQGGRVWIDFTGGGVVLRCDGNTHYLGTVDPSSVDPWAYCSQ